MNWYVMYKHIFLQTWHFYRLLVLPWKMRIVTFPCCIGCQNYRCAHTNNVISQELPAKYSTKPLSKILTSILTSVKMGLPKYHDTCFSRSGVNQMWILKKPSKDLLETLSSRSQYVCSSINIWFLYLINHNSTYATKI